MIINPMFFYLMYVSENFSMALILIGPITATIGALSFFFAYDMLCGKEQDCVIAFSKRMIPVGIILFIIGLLIPDKETLLLMQASALATTENVNSVFEALKAAIDYAVTILQ